jgi:hypothetical protein
LENLAQVAFEKVVHTLAAQLPASLRASDQEEKSIARGVCRCLDLRVVLHVEQPPKRSPLRPAGGIDASHLRQKLKQMLKPIDPHPVVASTDEMRNLPWRVR